MRFNNLRLELAVISLLFVLCSSSFTFAQTRKKPIAGQTKDIPLTARDIAKRVLPSTVMIITQDEKGEPIAQGSGFVYKRGLIATNLHVFNRATQAIVKFIGKDATYKVVEVVGINKRRDLCVVRINEIQIKSLRTSSATKTEVGNDVFVAANPIGLEGSFSKGIISAVRKNVGLLQIDAPISPGSSGGPVVNNNGDVIGMVVSSITSGQNLNFAIPIEYLESLSLTFKEPVIAAGALAFNDRQRKQLKGFVKSVEEVVAEFKFSRISGDYVEGDGQVDRRFDFDEYGNLVIETAYKDGKVAHTIQTSFDDAGFMRKRVYEDLVDYKTIGPTEFSVSESIQYEIRVRVFSNSRDVGISKEVYDRDGRLVEVIIPGSGPPSFRGVSLFGKNGFESEDQTYSLGELIESTRYSYEMDEQGNWTKRKSMYFNKDNGKLGFFPKSVTYRKITYFSD